jgi:hypothetical protein
MVLIAIRQPGYFPYLGFFKKIQTCDIFVFFDDAQYAIRAWDNRNKIKQDGETMWISVPVSEPFKKKLNEIKIANNEWIPKHILAIKKNYQRAPYFKDYWEDIESILNKKWEKLIDLNLALIEHFIQVLDIKTKIIRSSELDVEGSSSKKLLNICKKINADSYLSGIMGREYLDERIFKKEKINVVYENFIHPKYSQINGEFIPNLAVIDILFNEGENSKTILKKSKNIN